MKNEFENIEQAMKYFETVKSTEYFIRTFENIEEYMESKGLDVEGEDYLIEFNAVNQFFSKAKGLTVYELSSNGSGESELTTDLQDVYYFINDIN